MQALITLHSLNTGEKTKKKVSIEKALLTIGSNGADIVIASEHCSYRHAALHLNADGQVVLRDLRSRTGTFFHGKKIESAALKDGASFVIADTRLSLSIER